MLVMLPILILGNK